MTEDKREKFPPLRREAPSVADYWRIARRSGIRRAWTHASDRFFGPCNEFLAHLGHFAPEPMKLYVCCKMY